ncbi:MAG: DNA-deoxyinosine glycosylase [Planctomycetes bacterium]|nr:DNA-deoxyinosine glycosylase [Planctomycetota bacterium]MCP4771809.1 DNA-deoxyinosine glycosylase [Planctomycetota bacterium]MCP4860946.1 DNA-deoxyinosine glycosylase [Planctomycetota bacterium]
MLCKGFAPLLGDRAKVLILGSMPGAESIRQNQYYAFERNSFWWIMGELFGASWELPYEQRVTRLTDSGIAVWDVLASCQREGSLDSAIDQGSEVVNDFIGLLQEHPIELILLNGGKAKQAWKRSVQPIMAEHGLELQCLKMPSTSPAYAAMKVEAKLEKWRAALSATRQFPVLKSE